MEIASLFNVDFSMPLEKKSNNQDNILIPKISFRINPSDMKNYSSSDNKINAGNAFALNRLGLSDTLEAGKSLTLGLDYNNERKNNLDQINNYFELKLATVFRDKETYLKNIIICLIPFLFLIFLYVIFVKKTNFKPI